MDALRKQFFWENKTFWWYLYNEIAQQIMFCSTNEIFLGQWNNFVVQVPKKTYVGTKNCFCSVQKITPCHFLTGVYFVVTEERNFIILDMNSGVYSERKD